MTPLRDIGAKAVVCKALSWIEENVLRQLQVDEVSLRGWGGR